MALDFGRMIQSLGCRVWGLGIGSRLDGMGWGFRVWGLGIIVWGSEFRVEVPGSGFRV
jgi:hypothetical protein